MFAKQLLFFCIVLTAAQGLSQSCATMQKTILVTGSTDGIGLLAAKKLVAGGHHVLLHGRSKSKLRKAEKEISAQENSSGTVESYVADLSRFTDVEELAKSVKEKHDHLDVLINNAGVFKTSQPTTDDGLDVRFVVNMVSPYLLTQLLLPIINPSGRVVNLSSAAQAPVDLNAVMGGRPLSDSAAYAQSKLGITMWSRSLAKSLKSGPAVIALNPASLLGTKMVKEGYGFAGHDINIGADIICRAALSEEFANASGQYYDNDSKGFASPHGDALNDKKCQALVDAIETLLADKK